MIQPTPEEMDAQEASTLTFEDGATLAVTAGFVAQVTQAAAAIARAAVTRRADTAARVLDRIVPGMHLGLVRAVIEGNQLGREHAHALGVPATAKGAMTVVRDELLAVSTVKIDADAAAQLAKAKGLLQLLDLGSPTDVSTLTGAVVQAGSGAQRQARWTANRSVYHGVANECKAAGFGLLWRAERDACLHCLALSGYVVAPGQDFPPLTWADKPLPWSSPYPPRHNWCRCSVVPWSEGAHGEFDTSTQANALKREAERSVVRGFSNYASGPARVRAAERALTKGVNLPKTVLARAARDVKRGAFSSRHNRLVPSLPKGKGKD